MITLVTIYKAIVRPHLDYCDVLYDYAFSNSFYDRLESIQYKACFKIESSLTQIETAKFANFA